MAKNDHMPCWRNPDGGCKDRHVVEIDERGRSLTMPGWEVKRSYDELRRAWAEDWAGNTRVTRLRCERIALTCLTSTLQDPVSC